MAIDDTAVLELQVKIDQAVANIARFKEEYETAMAQLRAATAAGLGPGDEAWDRIKTRALLAGQSFIEAGEEARAGGAQMGEALGSVIPELGAIDDQLAIMRANLKQVEAQGVETGESLGTHLGDHVQGKLIATGLHMVAFIAVFDQLKDVAKALHVTEEGIGELVEPTKLAAEGARTAGEAWTKFQDSMASGRGIVGSVTDALKVQAGALPIVGRFLKDDTEETKKNTDEKRKAAEALEKYTAARKRQAEAEKEAAAAAKEAAKAEQEAFDASQKAAVDLAAQLRGPSNDALKESTDALIFRIQQLEKAGDTTDKYGATNQKVHDAIVKALDEEKKQYTDWGKTVPDSLQAAIDKYGALSTAAAAAHKEQMDQLTQQIQARNDAEAAKAGGGGDAAQKVEDLRKKVEELDSQTYLSPEQQSQLDTLKNDLADAEMATNRWSQAAADQAQSIADNSIPAYQQAQNALAELGNQFDSGATLGQRLAQSMDDGSESVSKLGSNFDAVNDRFRDVNEQQKDLTIATAAGTEAAAQQTAAFDKNAEAITGLQQHQDEFRQGLDSTAGSYQQLGDKAKDSTEKQATGHELLMKNAQEYKGVLIEIKGVHEEIETVMSRCVDLGSEFANVVGGGSTTAGDGAN